MKKVEKLSATRRVTCERKLPLLAQSVDSSRFSCIGSTGESNLGHACTWAKVKRGRRCLEMCVVEVNCHARILDASERFGGYNAGFV